MLGKDPLIACFDVYYQRDFARAAAIVFRQSDETIAGKYTAKISNDRIGNYVPGQFYKRELPGILGVLREIKEDMDIVIVDGFVTVGKNKKGLGAHLYGALGEKTPVIGVAKSFLGNSVGYLKVYRGQSSKPLYVSAIGVNLAYAAGLIKGLKGDFRLPDVLRKVDLLSRGGC